MHTLLTVHPRTAGLCLADALVYLSFQLVPKIINQLGLYKDVNNQTK